MGNRAGSQDLIELGNRIRERRNEISMSQEKVAEQAGISANTVSRIEGGQSAMSIEIFIKMVQILGVDANELLGVSGQTEGDGQCRKMFCRIRHLKQSELSPEGTGYRAKTRFARFFNLPELIALFKESADIQTADMLELPVPEAEYINEVLKPSEEQQDLVSSFAERAEIVRAGNVDPSRDNMLKITNDGRKCALDQRLINDMLPDAEESKVNRCVNNAFDIWEKTSADKGTQLIFCDLSTPKNDGTFNVYDDVREKLVAKGIPREEVAFIHEAGTETKKAELFSKVRSGQVRILLGSTPKLGAGTNIQDRLVALHHLDAPWKPADVGRILRTFKIKKNVEVTDNGKDNF